MRVLLVTHYYSTHAGGIEIVAGALATRLGASADVTWAASDSDPPPVMPARVRLLPMRAFNGIERATGLPFPLWGPGSLIRLWRASADVSVVHLHDVAYAGNWAAFVYARLRGRPVVITQHVGFIPYRSAVLRVVLKAMHRTIARVMLGSAAQVVFISPVVRDYFAAFVKYRRPPRIIWNGVDTSIYTAASAEDRAAARRTLGLAPAAPVLLFVGRFVEKKGLHVLEQLARMLPDAVFLVAGWGPIDPRDWRLPNVVVFNDRRGSALVPLYHAGDLLVLPSVGEGLPLVVQESMSCGTPVMVGTDTADAISAPERLVFRCEVAGEGTAEAWAGELRRILPTLPGRDDLRDAVARFARDRWSWDAGATAYRELFAELTA